MVTQSSTSAPALASSAAWPWRVERGGCWRSSLSQRTRGCGGPTAGASKQRRVWSRRRQHAEEQLWRRGSDGSSEAASSEAGRAALVYGLDRSDGVTNTWRHSCGGSRTISRTDTPGRLRCRRSCLGSMGLHRAGEGTETDGSGVELRQADVKGRSSSSSVGLSQGRGREFAGSSSSGRSPKSGGWQSSARWWRGLSAKASACGTRARAAGSLLEEWPWPFDAVICSVNVQTPNAYRLSYDTCTCTVHMQQDSTMVHVQAHARTGLSRRRAVSCVALHAR